MIFWYRPSSNSSSAKRSEKVCNGASVYRADHRRCDGGVETTRQVGTDRDVASQEAQPGRLHDPLAQGGFVLDGVLDRLMSLLGE